MIQKIITLDCQGIILSAEEEVKAEIRVWVNEEANLYLPLVYEGELTIRLTPAGLAVLKAALKEAHALRLSRDIKTVEFF